MMVMAKVYIKRIESGECIHEIDVSNVIGTSNYDRFLSGLLNKTDLDRYFVDTCEAEKAHEEARARARLLRHLYSRSSATSGRTQS